MILILIPTRLEAQHLIGNEPLSPGQPILRHWHGEKVHVALCGFGLAVAGVNTSHALSIMATTAPADHVFLLGTAGVYDATRFPVGTCVAADHVQCVGLGIPTSSGRYTLNLPQNGKLGHDVDRLALQLPAAELPRGCFLSVAGAADAETAAERRKMYPDGVAEEMEGYAVALACDLWNLPLTMIRGISNVAGDRDKKHWRIAEALSAVNSALRDAVSSL